MPMRISMSTKPLTPVETRFEHFPLLLSFFNY